MASSSRKEAIWDIQFSRLVEAMKLHGLTEVTSGRGSLHSFVSGLLLSSAIKGEMRRVAPEWLHLGWGQVLDESDVLSGEIDILAYRGKPLHQWEDLGFSLVSKENVDFIIEVKRSWPSYSSLEYELKRLSQYCEKMFLIIYETNNRMKGIKNRENRLRKIGYRDVFHFVRWEKENYYLLRENWYRLMKTVSEWQ